MNRTADCERDIKEMLAGDKHAEAVCREFLKGLGQSDKTPIEAVASMLRGAIKVRNQHEAN